MSRIIDKASAISVAATIIVTLISADGSGAAPKNRLPQAKPQTSTSPFIAEPPLFIAEPVVQPVPQAEQANNAVSGTESAPASAATLRQMVEAQPQPDELPRELNCLAGAIYFEAKGETLPGQLAVGRVIVARSKSGRFPASYCGVVYQPSQFSFVRGSGMPAIDKRSGNWRKAVAIAQIAHSGSWQSPVEGALYFHAARVSPGWHLRRMAQVDNHIFYR